MHRTSKDFAQNVLGQNFIPVDVIASFNKDWGIQPLYFRFKNKSEELLTYQIEKIVVESCCSNFVDYLCEVEVCGILKQIHLSYLMQQLRWCIIKDPSLLPK